MTNRIGPKTEPGGTPQLRVADKDILFSSNKLSLK